jgi:hypothetical protein
MEEFSDHFADVPDPRAANARHDFLEVIFIALAAVLCGAEDCTDMALFGRALSLSRKLALNLLRQHPDKGSIKGKIKRVSWNDHFLLSLLSQMR